LGGFRFRGCEPESIELQKCRASQKPGALIAIYKGMAQLFLAIRNLQKGRYTTDSIAAPGQFGQVYDIALSYFHV